MRHCHKWRRGPVSYTHLRAHETSLHLVCRLLLESIPVRVLNLRLSVIGKRPEVDIASLARGERAASADDCHLADQKIFAGGQWHDGAIIDRLRLPAGAVVNGPCLLVQPDATIYVDPGLAARVDDLGNIIIKE